MKPALIALLSVLSLAACQRKAEGPPPPPPIGGPPPAPPAPAPTQASFIGRWAATADLCAKGAWMFEADRLSTAGEVGCVFKTVTSVGSGYRIEALCTAQAPPEPQTFTLTMLPANPPAMTVMGGPWRAPITLHLCAG
ncbi:hypothetical protein [Phenylobacterium sp.]|uniref:hypothetical protein n=1 Tax=Phenylobacterium sp. TaxID=1871053 RepID=UPI0030F45BB1